MVCAMAMAQQRLFLPPDSRNNQIDATPHGTCAAVSVQRLCQPTQRNALMRVVVTAALSLVHVLH